MSTSLLYHAFGIRGYRYVRTDYLEGEVVFSIEQGRHTYQCPVCGSRQVTAHGEVARLFRGVPIGAKPVSLGASKPATYGRFKTGQGSELSGTPVALLSVRS
jgi:transposase